MSEQPERKPSHSKLVRLSESRGKVEQPKGQFKDLFKKGTDKGNDKRKQPSIPIASVLPERITSPSKASDA